MLSAAARAILNAPADPGGSDITNLGASGWEVQSSAVATQTGAQISTPGFNTSTWLPVTNDDAGAPGTEIEALLQNGLCPGDTALQPVNQSTSSPNSVFFSNNMQLCYGFASKIGAGLGQRVQRAVVVAHRFHTEPAAGQVAKRDRQRRHRLGQRLGERHRGRDLGDSHRGLHPVHLQHLAAWSCPAPTRSRSRSIRTTPPSMFTLDNVDWTQIPPDNNTGIQFPVQLQVDGALSVGNSHVNQSDAANLSSAALTVKTDVTNNTTTSQTGTVTASDHAAWQWNADHGEPERHGSGEHDSDGLVHAERIPEPDDHQPAGVVAIPARRPAALHAGRLGCARHARSTTRRPKHSGSGL